MRNRSMRIVLSYHPCMKRIISYLSILVSLAVLDRFRLGVVMKQKINLWLGHLMKPALSFGPAWAWYVCYAGAVLYFAVLPALQQHNRRLAVLNGALLWCIAYMTYDFTNRATLKDRPVALVLPDIIWGSVVTAIVAFIWYHVALKFL